MNRIARWLFRRIVAPRIIGYIWVGQFPAYPGEVVSPDEVEVVFRD